MLANEYEQGKVVYVKRASGVVQSCWLKRGIIEKRRETSDGDKWFIRFDHKDRMTTGLWLEPERVVPNLDDEESFYIFTYYAANNGETKYGQH